MLSLMNVTKTFEGLYEPVLKNINLRVEQGEFCILLGSNGSGKSTLMRLISGEYLADYGQILIEGRDLCNQDKASLIATVVQDVNQGTISEMTLLENMVLSLLRGKKAKIKHYDHYKAECIQAITSLDLKLESYIDTPMNFLSGGQRQTLATLMSIMSLPKLLLLDEHTSALDPKSQKVLMELTAKTVNKNKTTCLMITHKLEDALYYGDRLIMMHKGKIVFDVKGKDKSNLTIAKLNQLYYQFESMELNTDLNITVESL